MTGSPPLRRSRGSRLLRGLLAAVVAYVAGALLCYWLILASTSNAHDPTLEASMTAAFVRGPIAAIVGLIVGMRWR